jgi:hypothetical protein
METDGEPGPDKRDSHAKPEEEPPGVEEGKKDEAANHGKGDAVQVSLEPYRTWTARRLPDPRSVAQFNVAERLTEIIAAEGPIICHRAYRIYLGAAGMTVESQSIKFEIFQILHRAIRTAETMGWIEERNEYATLDQVNQIVRKAGTPAVVLRACGDRTFQEIPPAEVGELMNYLWKCKPNLDDEGLIQSVLSHYEIEDMTSEIRTALIWIKAQYANRSGH